MNSSEASISVVITCYNQARYLGEAVESVLAQTRRHTEIIVVDDGSKDDTAAVVAKYPSLRYIAQQNQGVAVARNVGLRECKGDFVVLLDGDDRLLPTALETNLNRLLSNPECAFAAGHNIFIDNEGAHIKEYGRAPLIEGDPYLALLHNNFIIMPAMVMYRRSVFETVGGFTLSADHSCDYDLYLRIAEKFPVCCHDEVVAEQRIHDSNTSHKAAMMLKSTMKVFRAQKAFVKGNKRREEAYKTGARNWQERYGDEVIERLRTHVRQEGRDGWKRVVRDALVLLRYSPRVLAKHAVRKGTLMLTRGSSTNT